MGWKAEEWEGSEFIDSQSTIFFQNNFLLLKKLWIRYELTDDSVSPMIISTEGIDTRYIWVGRSIWINSLHSSLIVFSPRGGRYDPIPNEEDELSMRDWGVGSFTVSKAKENEEWREGRKKGNNHLSYCYHIELVRKEKHRLRIEC